MLDSYNSSFVSSPLNLNKEISRLYPTVRKTVAKRLKGAGCDYDDIVQDIFLRFIKGVREGKYTGKAGYSTLLYYITNGKIKDILRKKYKEEEFWRKVKHSEFEKVISHSVSLKERDMMRRRFKRNFKKLTAKQRGVIKFYGMAGLPALEVSAIIGVSSKRISQFYGLSLARLRKLFRLGRPWPHGSDCFCCICENVRRKHADNKCER